MSALDFALKDLYRKRQSNYPFLLIITIIIALTEFLIYFTSSIGLNIFYQTAFMNRFYFSGGISSMYKQFNSLIQIILIILTIAIVITVTTTLVISKKRDIAIMKALGTLPRKLYSFYLLESYILYFIGFLFGLILGLVAFGVFALIMIFINFPIIIQIDLFYTPILFFCCILGIFFFTGYTLRKIGRQNIINTFSKDLPYDYDASKQINFIPKWLISIGFNIKMAIVNTLRKKGEFRRYLFIFSIIGLVIFTLGLGTIVLRTTTQKWINSSQNENIIIIGHIDVLNSYSSMYRMFSEPNLIIEESNINFLEPHYLFNLSDVNELFNISEVEKIDERLVNFYSVEEIPGIIIHEDDSYEIIGQHRTEIIPIIGINPDNLIQNFETEGAFFTNEDAYYNMSVGDGLANNLFDYAIYQSLRLDLIGSTFHISGVVIDSLYSGWAGYVGLDIIQQALNLSSEINLISIKIQDGAYSKIENSLENISDSIGENFTYLKLDEIFQSNLDFLSNLSLYPISLIIVISILSILSLYNYQKAGIMEKAKDFLIMRAIGSKTSSLKRILFLESIFILLPSLLLSLAIGMIVNSLFLFNRVFLPPLYVPFIVFLILFVIFIIFNFLSTFPIIKKINNFTVKDFTMY
ncbi:MAG: FtsX-like permease family protein [Promethearchaeota archaeon]